MLDYARQRAADALKTPRAVILATSGPAGVQASEVKCEALELALFLLVPQTSDHLFNLEGNSDVTLLTSWLEIKGVAHILSAIPEGLDLRLLRESEAGWCALVRVDPQQVQIRNPGGWGYVETIDITPIMGSNK
ncbi:MAG: hypothetical protein WBV22_05780 [Anaerolineaceae bacterium]